MAAEGASAVEDEIAVFDLAVIINYLHERIAFGTERGFQDALLHLGRHCAPQQRGFIGESLFAHAGNVSNDRRRHNFRMHSRDVSHLPDLANPAVVAETTSGIILRAYEKNTQPSKAATFVPPVRQKSVRQFSQASI